MILFRRSTNDDNDKFDIDKLMMSIGRLGLSRISNDLNITQQVQILGWSFIIDRWYAFELDYSDEL